jgi:hypothetical protein
MPLDAIPTAFPSDGNWTVTWVPSGSNPLSVAILNGATAIDMTYSFTQDGFAYAISQDNVEDKRLTLKQNLSAAGRFTETLALRYVRSKDLLSAYVTLKEGVSGFFVVRRGVLNGTAYAVSTQTVDVLTITLGKQSPDAPTENGLDYVSQNVYFTAATQPDAVLVA